MMKDTKQKIFDEALNMLGEDGFSGITLGTLANRVGLSKSGLFAHFKSKDELEEQLLTQVTGKSNAFIAAALSEPPGIGRLTAFFQGWLGWTGKAGMKGGCPITAGFFEYDDAPLENSTRMKLQKISADWHKTLLSICSETVEAGGLKADLDLEQFLFELYGIYLSHHVYLRFNGDEKADKKAMKAFTRLVEDNRPPKR